MIFLWDGTIWQSKAPVPMKLAHSIMLFIFDLACLQFMLARELPTLLCDYLKWWWNESFFHLLTCHSTNGTFWADVNGLMLMLYNFHIVVSISRWTHHAEYTCLLTTWAGRWWMPSRLFSIRLQQSGMNNAAAPCQRPTSQARAPWEWIYDAIRSSAMLLVMLSTKAGVRRQQHPILRQLVPPHQQIHPAL